MKTWKQLEAEYWRNLEAAAPNAEYALEYKAFRLGVEFNKLTPSQQRDFTFYLENGRNEKCYPNHFSSPSKLCYKPSSVEEWFWLWDTHGFAKEKELSQPVVNDCEAIKQSKASVNLTIKMWVEDTVEFPAATDFETLRHAYPMPWVWKAFVGQLHKAFTAKHGFVTTFIKNSTQTV